MDINTHVLAGPKEATLLKGLTEFANMSAEPAAWEHFRKRLPDFFPPELFKESEEALVVNAEWAKQPISAEKIESPHFHLYELDRFSVKEAQFKPVGDGEFYVQHSEPEILRLRDLLRDVWGRDRQADTSLGKLLGLERAAGSLRVSADWKRATLIYHPQNPFEAACYALLQKCALAKMCANPDCPAPYFIAKRPIQRYCTPDCLKPFQKQWKRTWWEREGKSRRDSKLRRRRGKRR